MNQFILYLIGIALLWIGAVLGYYARQSILRKRKGSIEAKLQKKISQTKAEAEEILEKAREKAKEVVAAAQKDSDERRDQILKTERILLKREHTLDEKISLFEDKEKEFKELYKDDKKPKNYVKEVQIDTDFEVLIPDDYISVISERLSLYNKLGDLKTEEELAQFETDIIDRFGEIPTQVVDLLNSVRIKWIAKEIGLERIILKQKRLIGYFISDQQSDFYQTENFTRVLQYLQKNPKSCVMKEKQTKNGLRLLITFIHIDSVEKALEVLKRV